jgi:hypothetical protein
MLITDLGHQFYQYQQNKKSPFILIELTEHKKTGTYDVGNPGVCLGQAQKCGGVKLVSCLYPILLDKQ